MAGRTVGQGDAGTPVLSDVEGPIIDDPAKIDPTISGD
jgi:hypothetical protein